MSARERAALGPACRRARFKENIDLVITGNADAAMQAFLRGSQANAATDADWAFGLKTGSRTRWLARRGGHGRRWPYRDVHSVAQLALPCVSGAGQRAGIAVPR